MVFPREIHPLCAVRIISTLCRPHQRHSPINHRILAAHIEVNMADSPTENEIKYTRFLNVLKTLAPDKTFGGVTLAQFEAQVEKSNIPRASIETLNDQKKQEEATRDAEDLATMKLCEMIKKGVVADPAFGDDSAVYEALGYVRKSNRKSGLTRRRKTELKPE